VNFPNVAILHMGFHNKERHPERQKNFFMQSKHRHLMPSKIFVSVTEHTLKNIVNRQSIGPFAACHSRGTKPPCWRAKVALGQDKQRKLPFKIMYVFCLSCPSANFALQRDGFVPREWLAAKGLLCAKFSMCKFRHPSLLYPYPKFRPLKLRRLLH